MEEKQKRGFALLPKERVREIAAMGSRAVKNRHQWTSEEAKAAGRKGGLTTQEARRKASDENG